MKIGLIGCGKDKSPIRCKAEEMYIGGYFKLGLKFARKSFEKIYILSAKYGLLELEDMIEPYNMTLNTMDNNEIYVWSKRVAEALKSKLNKDDVVTFVCGKEYYKYLKGMLPCKYVLLFDGSGMGIGKQMAYFKRMSV